MSRFNDNQDGTITDTETSLTWQKKKFCHMGVPGV